MGTGVWSVGVVTGCLQCVCAVVCVQWQWSVDEVSWEVGGGAQWVWSVGWSVSVVMGGGQQVWLHGGGQWGLGSGWGQWGGE